MTDAVQKMIEHLEEPGLRVRTGILLASPSDLDRAEEISARLNATPEDMAQELLHLLPAGTRYANLSVERVLEVIDVISNRSQGSRLALLLHLDLLISALDKTACEEVWYRYLYALPHRRRVLIALMPEQYAVLPHNIAELEAVRRCARWKEQPSSPEHSSVAPHI